MHAWEAIQKTLNHIEEHIGEDMRIEELAEIAALSLFYYQRLFTRLVKISVREYIKLRRLARAEILLRKKDKRIIDIAMEFGFGSHETFTRTFKEVYGITPSQYRGKLMHLAKFEKPDLSLNYMLVSEGAPLVSDGVVIEINRKFLEETIRFSGVLGYYPFKFGKMLGERTGVDKVGEIWERFYQEIPHIVHASRGHRIGISFHGDAQDDFSSYFVGVEVGREGETEKNAVYHYVDGGLQIKKSANLVDIRLPAREYVVCGFEAENHEQMLVSMGKAMRYTRFWLREHGLTADGFFPEIYDYSRLSVIGVELWIPFKKRRMN